jgi:phosphoribosylformimino-5-aminoimidazole carboxamide ribotide isomerase
MLIPAIDLMGGRIVQLVQGEELRIASNDFDYWIDRFRAYPLVQLIDLDAAKRQGSNRDLIARIARELPVQVGGGVRTVADAQALLDVGARRVIFGSALFPAGQQTSNRNSRVDLSLAETLSAAIGTDRFFASIDTKNGRIAVRGWRDQTSLTPDDAILALEELCGGFLYTHVDTEGTLQGFPLPVARRLRALTKKHLIVAGGIREQMEIDALDRLQIDAVAGMAVYTGLIAT